MKASKLTKIIPEFALAAICCRWPPSADRNEAVVRALDHVDWRLFAALVSRHRVAGLVWDALRRGGVDPPPAISDQLGAAARTIAAQNLELAAASIRLKRAFDVADIPILFLKGLTLGQLAYHDILLKMGWDIDVLIPPERLEDAAVVLEAEGYQLILPKPPVGRERLSVWHGRSKESVWRDANGAHVELHSRLTDNVALLPGLDCHSPRQDLAVLGHLLPTLQIDELFAYLCVHGASSSWFRLKWIADLAALLNPFDADEIDRLYRASQHLGAGRAAAQALLLAAHLFDTRISVDLAKELNAGRVNRWLFAGALRKLAGRTVTTELHHARLGTASIHLMQLGLLPGWKYKLSEIARQAVSAEEIVKSRLPRALYFLNPVRLLVRRARRSGG